MAAKDIGKPMTFPLQVYTVGRIVFKCCLFDSYCDDFTDHMDRSLTLPENITNVIDILSGKEAMDEIRGEMNLRYWSGING
jgi:hypothetical protein